MRADFDTLFMFDSVTPVALQILISLFSQLIFRDVKPFFKVLFLY